MLLEYIPLFYSGGSALAPVDQAALVQWLTAYDGEFTDAIDVLTKPDVINCNSIVLNGTDQGIDVPELTYGDTFTIKFSGYFYADDPAYAPYWATKDATVAEGQIVVERQDTFDRLEVVLYPPGGTRQVFAPGGQANIYDGEYHEVQIDVTLTTVDITIDGVAATQSSFTGGDFGSQTATIGKRDTRFSNMQPLYYRKDDDFEWVFQEGAEDECYDVLGTDVIGTIDAGSGSVDDMRNVTQSVFSHNASYGFTLYQHATKPDLRVPNYRDGTPHILDVGEIPTDYVFIGTSPGGSDV